jgi:hypothetical protein
VPTLHRTGQGCGSGTTGGSGGGVRHPASERAGVAAVVAATCQRCRVSITLVELAALWKLPAETIRRRGLPAHPRGGVNPDKVVVRTDGGRGKLGPRRLASQRAMSALGRAERRSAGPYREDRQPAVLRNLHMPYLCFMQLVLLPRPYNRDNGLVRWLSSLACNDGSGLRRLHGSGVDRGGL